jgi:hypothetical protein
MRRKAIIATLLVALAAPAAALADPDFGPGNSNKGPQDGKCHPPGQVLPSPECKG